MGIPEDLSLLDRNLDKLKQEWDNYFRGLNKVPPHNLQTAVNRLIRKYAGQPLVNSAQRFRYQNLVARYNSLNELWNRKMRMKEEGIVIGAPQRLGHTASAPKAPKADSKKEVSPETGKGRSKRPSAGAFTATTSQPLKEPKVVKSIYNEYMRAQKASGGAVKKVSPQSFQKLIAKQVEAIKKSYGCSAVNFRVQVKDGQVKLKAKPVK